MPASLDTAKGAERLWRKAEALQPPHGFGHLAPHTVTAVVAWRGVARLCRRHQLAAVFFVSFLRSLLGGGC